MAKILNNLFTTKIMSTEPMTLRDLRVQTFKERKEGRLTKLPATFYRRLKILEIQIREIIEESKDNAQRLEKANADVRKFSDMKLELHKNRERKLTDLAREKVNGQNPNMENIHQNENEYLISLCSVIEKHRANTLLNEISIDANTPVLEEKKIEPEEKTAKKIEPRNDEYIEIKWEPVSDFNYFYQYEIWRSSDEILSEDDTIIVIPTWEIDHYLDRGVGSGTSWYYSVATVDINGRKRFSNFVRGWTTIW
mgnify:CR=1 FL=1